jgi:hypothetical protein
MMYEAHKGRRGHIAPRWIIKDGITLGWSYAPLEHMKEEFPKDFEGALQVLLSLPAPRFRVSYCLHAGNILVFGYDPREGRISSEVWAHQDSVPLL